MSLDRLLTSLRPGGRDFEHLCKWRLENVSRYQSRLKQVWLWDDWPGRGSRDIGIDLVAEDREGGLWAIQANTTTPRTRSRVTCMSVNGNKAAIGGVVVVVGGNIGNPGDVYVQYFVDRGTTSPSTPQHDYMSAIYTVTPPLNEEWPAGFPNVCPPADGTSTLEQAGGSLALLPYDAVRAAPGPRNTLLSFLETAYRAGAGLSGWIRRHSPLRGVPARHN